LEQLNEYLKKFKIAASILGGTLFIFIILLTRIIPAAGEVVKVQKQTRTAQESIADAQRKINDIKTESEKRLSEETNLEERMFYKPIDSGMDTESIISEELAEIVALIRENRVKVRSMTYNYDPLDDNFIKNAGAKFTACRLDMEMVANYKDFERFMKDLYKNPNFLDISKIEIVPYSKNKRILIVNAQIKLYAQRGSTPAPAVEQARPAQSAPQAAQEAGPMNGIGPETVPEIDEF
jgi:hypothetical protein